MVDRVSRRVLRVVLTTLLPVLVAFGGAQAEVRIAVLSAPDVQSAADSLMAALSQSEEIVLVERADIQTIEREQGLAELIADSTSLEKAGRLLNADMIIALDHPTDAGKVLMRLIAVQPAVIISDEAFSWPIEDISGWSAFAASRVARSAAELPFGPKSKTLIGVLGVRSAFGGNTAQIIEREANFLVTRALVQLPNVFVLERLKMRDTDWERQIADGESMQYWSSAWLLDGSITAEGSKMVFGGRLQSMQGSAPRDVRAEGTDLPALASAVASRISQVLQLPEALPASANSNETDQFKAEAEWAFRWKQYDQAERAADASWALGNRSQEMGVLRAKIPIAAAESTCSLPVNLLLTSSLPPETLALFVRGIGNLEQLLAVMKSGGQEISSASVNELSDMTERVGLILAHYYYMARSRTVEEQASLGWVRAKMREVIPLLIAGSKQNLAKMEPREFQNIASWPDEPPARFFATYGLYASYFGDTVEQSLALFADAISQIESLDPRMTTWMKKRIIADRGPHLPIGVAWTEAERPQVSPLRAKLYQGMVERGGVHKLDGLTLGILRYYHPTLRFTSRVPNAASLGALDLYAQGIWDLRYDILKGEINPNEAASSLFVFDQVAGAFKSSAKSNETRRRFAQFLLENKWNGDRTLYGTLMEGAFSMEERDEVYRQIAMFGKPAPAAQSGAGSPPASRPPSIPAPTPATTVNSAGQALKPTRVFDIGEGGNVVILEAQSLGSKVWFLLSTPSQPTVVREIDTADGSQRTWNIDRGENMSSPLHFAVDEDCFYFADKERFFRFRRSTGVLDQREIPAIGNWVSGIWAVGGSVYISGEGGSIVKVDPQTLDSELLASARRKPAQTILDDQPPYAVDAVFLNSGGQCLFGMADRATLHAWNPETRNFDLAYAGKFFSRDAQLDRDLMLRWTRARGKFQVHWLLLSANAQGRTNIKRWPPEISLDGKGRSANDIHGAVVLGDDLYFYFTNRSNQRTLAVQGQGSTVLDIGKQELFVYARAIACNDGVVFFDVHTRIQNVLFYSKADLDKATR